MTGQEAIDRIRQIIDDEAMTRFTTDVAVLSYLQEVDDILYPLVIGAGVNDGLTVDTSTWSISQGTTTVSLGAGAVQAIKHFSIPSESGELTLTNWADLLKLWGDNESNTGKPSKYMHVGATVYVGPVPDADYALTVLYWPVHTLTLSADLPYSGLLDTFYIRSAIRLMQAQEEYDTGVYQLIEIQAQRSLMRMLEIRRGAATRSQNVRVSWPSRL